MLSPDFTNGGYLAVFWRYFGGCVAVNGGHIGDPCPS